MKATIKLRRIRRILVIFWGRYGDVIVTLPLMECLKRRFPKTRITYFISTPYSLQNLESGGRILENNPFVSKWVEADISALRSVAASPSYDLAIDLSLKRKFSDLLCYLSGAEVKIWGKFRAIPRNFFWSRRLRSGRWDRRQKVKIPAGLSRVDQFCEPARSLGARCSGILVPKIYLSRFEKDLAADFLIEAQKFRQATDGNHALVGFHPGSMSRQERLWNARSYAAVADHAAGQLGACPVLFHGAMEKALAKRIVRWSKHGIKTVFEKDLRKLFSKLSACRFFITTDGGQLHMALSLGVPCVGLFTRKDIVRYWYKPYIRQGLLLPVEINGPRFRKSEIEKVIRGFKRLKGRYERDRV